jgi:hypothetical protein
MSVGFQSQFLNKFKEKDDKGAGGNTNSIKNSKPCLNIGSVEESENMISEKSASNKESGGVVHNPQTKQSNNSTFNISNTHDSKFGLLKPGKNNILETLNKPSSKPIIFK